MTTPTPAPATSPTATAPPSSPPASPWLIAVEGVVRPKPVLRARMQQQYGGKGRGRHEAIEWQAGQTLGACYAVLGVTGALRPVVVAPGHADELHRADRGGTGALEDHYPLVLCGREERPAHWPPNDTTATGRTRGQHERAAWAVAMRAATAAAGLAWAPRELLALRGLPPTIGVDPGADWTAIVACAGPEVWAAATVGRITAGAGVSGFDIDVAYVTRIVTTLAHLMTTYRPQAEAARRRLEATG